MGMTMAEKVLATHTNSYKVKAGDFVLASPDLVLLNDISGPLAIKQLENHGVNIAMPSKVVIVLDHLSPPPTIMAAQNNKAMRLFAGKESIKLFDVGEGIEHTLLPERNLIKPGYLVAGGDSHTVTYGAFNAFGSGFGATDIAVTMALDLLWLKVPEAQKFTVVGQRAPFTTGKDLILTIIRDIGVDGANYQSMEFMGSGLLGFNIDEYMAICNMSVEAGAKTCIIEANDVIKEWAKAKLGSDKHQYVKPDPDARYVEEWIYDASRLEPMVAKPHTPSNAVPVSEAEGIHVDEVYIGNCANGTLTDLRQAASVLRGRRVAKGTRLIIVPATRGIYVEALREGLIDVFINAGAVISPPTCGACAGLHMGLLGDGETAVATINRNFIGRMGSPKASVYLANAYVAAAAAVTGEITHPGKIINWGQE
ncbi:MAG: 3-isopropylmalate dehydratase large subunit [Thermocladium sp.]|jgi:3-isopropylmalate/(R)-2-methylmalate dehydratase large subunit